MEDQFVEEQKPIEFNARQIPLPSRGDRAMALLLL
jgi:hypothetical protein